MFDDISLDEECPCGSGKNFGYCCGRDQICDCRSGLPACECCYFPEQQEEEDASIKQHSI